MIKTILAFWDKSSDLLGFLLEFYKGQNHPSKLSPGPTYTTGFQAVNPLKVEFDPGQRDDKFNLTNDMAKMIWLRPYLINIASHCLGFFSIGYLERHFARVSIHIGSSKVMRIVKDVRITFPDMLGTIGG